MSTQFAGGCICGAVRYRCAVEPMAMYNCHCRICQRTGGAPFSCLLVMQRSAVTVSGMPKSAQARRQDGSHGRHGFCPDCGSSLFLSDPERPEILLIKAGTLDDPGGYSAIADIWAIAALPWTRMDYRIPKVLKSPPLLEQDGAVSL